MEGLCKVASTSLVTVTCQTCGHISTMSFRSLTKRLHKDKCSKCVTQARKSIEFVRNEFEKRGYTLLTDHYINAHQHLEYSCKKHPDQVQTIIYNSLQRGSGCRYCGFEKRSKRKSLTMKKLMEVVKTTPYTFISCDLEAGSKSVVKLFCEKHQLHFELSYNNIQQGNGCYECGYDSIRGQNNFNFKGETVYPSQYIRSYLTEWKQEAARKANYCCLLTGIGRDVTDFDIHHTLSSKTVLQEALVQLYGLSPIPSKLTKECLDEVMPIYLAKHNSVEGVFISHSIHKLYHSFYGMKDTTPEDYEEFRSDFTKGWIVFTNPFTSRKYNRTKRNKANDMP